VQRLSNNDLHVARCIANELAQVDEGSLSFFQLIGRRPTAQQAARVFYSMLALQNDNIISLSQDEPYADIEIESTANTAMYAYSPTT
jgi:chromatin segregation and condensation protein Rec8/ScpA/Scc1 (kleisin family)